MGDSWRPGANGNGYGDSGPSNRRRHHDQRDRDPYPPADRYSRNHSPPRAHMNDYSAPRRESGYSFRGAAQSADFSFRAPNDSYAPPTFPNAPPPQRAPPSRPKRNGPKNTNYNNNSGRRDNNQGRREWKPKPAHKRAILQTDRESTPEQLIGMASDSQPKFAEVVSSDDDEDGSDDDSEVEEGEDGPSRKRVKSEAAIPPPAEPSRPKWSNPDPYSAAPPTDLGLQPKKDIVQSIRKAKIQANQKAASTNAIKENADFISFDMGNDNNSAQADDSSQGNDEDFVGAPLALDGLPPPPPPGSPPPPPPPPPDDSTMPTDEEVMANYVGGKKRKRGPEQARSPSAGHIVTDWLPDGSDPTPWVNGKKYNFTASAGLQLHLEILDFHEYVSPREYEAKCRRDVIDRVRDVVCTFRPGGGTGVRVEAFGSFASDLYLPTADLDLVAVSDEYLRRGHKLFCQTNSKMYKLANQLEGLTAKHDKVIVITKAKVPIVKFTDEETNLKVDISFENTTGLDTIPTLVGWKTQYPQMPVLVSIIKQFLAMRGRNEVFSGGIGGFTIICLVVSMLQLKPELQGKLNSVGYGELLQDFFDLYGNKFDFKSTGIRMVPPGYFRKGIDPVSVKFNPNTLTIIDPNRADNDISGGSREIEAVFACFRGAHSLIQRELDQIRKGDSPPRSILGCILGGNYSSFEGQRELLFRVDRDKGSHQGYRQPFARPPPPPAQYYNSYMAPHPPAANRAPTYYDYQSYDSRPQQYLPPPPRNLPARPPPSARAPPPPRGAAPQPDDAASRAKKPKKGKAKKKVEQPEASSSNAAVQRQPTLSTGTGPSASKLEKKKQKKRNKAEKRKNAAKGDTAAHAS